MFRGAKEHRLFFVIATVAMFFSFAFNVFGAVSTDDFIKNYKDSEALVVNQMSCYGKLYGDQMLAPNETNRSNDLHACSENVYVPYSSQFGLQGKTDTLLFSIVSRVVHLPVGAFAAFLQLMTALLSAVLFGMLALWARQNIGKIPSVVFIILISLSPMIVGFARNLYWALPLMIAPVIYVLYLYKFNVPKRQALFFTGLGVLLYLRYLCGYEYITTITIMVFAAAGYWLVLQKVALKNIIKQGLIFGIVSILAFSAALVTHIAVLNTYTKSTEKSIMTIKDRAQERTLNAAKYSKYPYGNLQGLANDYYRTTDTYVHYEKFMNNGSLVLAGLVALSNYLLLPVVHIPVVLAGSFNLYLHSMVVFTILLVLLYIHRRKWVSKKARARVDALFAAATIGFVGYLSWLVFGYSHALVHAHINGILMYLPYALFGFMIMGLYIEFLINKYIQKK